MESMTRSCEYKGQPATFHRWVEVRKCISRGLTVLNDHPGGIIADTFALIEMQDGTVCRVTPESIRFTDKTDG